jgi:hypothetical protein
MLFLHGIGIGNYVFCDAVGVVVNARPSQFRQV